MTPQAERPHIVLATPCFGGVVQSGYMLSVCALIEAARARGVTVELRFLGGDALITRARSVLAAQFLDCASATHLLFVDADIAFAPEQVFRLLDRDVAFAGAFYPAKTIDWAELPRRVVAGEPLATAGLRYVGTLLDEPDRRWCGSFATALYAGTGFQLLRRSVFEDMIAAHPELRFRSTHTAGPDVPAADHLYALFDCLIDPGTGAYLSEDYAFCRRWRALGGDIWLDCGSRLDHCGGGVFQGDARTRFATQMPRDDIASLPKG